MNTTTRERKSRLAGGTAAKLRMRLITLGCAKNQVDSEYLMGGLASAGVEFTEENEELDAVIINTCGFIEAAKEESIETILQAVALKQAGKCDKVFVTGCLSQRYGDVLRREIPELDGVYGNRDLRRVVLAIALQLDLRYHLLGERQLLSPRHYAYLKISEGCEHPCTFCAIPAIRGKFRSVPIVQLVREAERLANRGVKELVLIAQDTTVYGVDLYGEKKLPDLLRRLSRVEGIEWIRLMYAYPYHVTEELIETLAGTPKICRYLDMPVQHVSSRMLKRMARRMSGEKQHRLIEQLRAAIPDLVLRTSVIVGFPGETEADFQALYDYVSKGHFDRLGVFVYSREDGTPAAAFADQVSDEVKRDRQAMLVQIQDEVMAEKNAAQVGQTRRVLVDAFESETGVYIGRTEWDCPEVDQTVILRESCTPGHFYEVTIFDATSHELFATVLNKSANHAYHQGKQSIQLPVMGVN